jgi:hypothetical protein
VALQIDASKAFRFHDELLQLVHAVIAAGSADEGRWIEWKSTADLTSNDELVKHLVRHMIGFANREVATAARWAEGHSYLIIGAQPGGATGMTPIDMAELAPRIRRYAGVDLRWHGEYLIINGTDVLVVTVEPPRHGDPIRLLETTSVGYAAGTIFVRGAANTDPSRPEDIRMLELRLMASKNQLHLGIEVLATIETWPPIDELVASWQQDQESELLAYLEQPARLSPSESAYYLRSFYLPDERTADDYRQEVAKYLESSGTALRARALRRLADEHPTDLRLQAHNTTERGIRDLHVDVRIAGRVWEQPRGTRMHKDGIPMPTKVRPFGRGRLQMDPFARNALFAELSKLAHVGGAGHLVGAVLPALGGPKRPTFTASVVDGQMAIEFSSFELRAEGRHALPPVRLAVEEPADTVLLVEWSATAGNLDGRPTSSVSVPIESSSFDLASLASDLATHDTSAPG